LLGKTLLHIVQNPIEIEQKGKRARYLYEIKYSAEIAKERLLGIYNKITDTFPD
jgi:hypothetical protein